MKHGFGFSAVIAAVFAATPSVAQNVDTSTFLKKAGASDLYERQSSELVRMSSDPNIKNFAQKMIKDHTDSTNKVKSAAAQAGLKVSPPKLDAAQAKMISDLRAANGSARDKLYVSQQKTAHQQALALHQNYAANGDAPSLKQVAGKIVPVVQHHIEMLNGMGGM